MALVFLGVVIAVGWWYMMRVVVAIESYINDLVVVELQQIEALGNLKIRQDKEISDLKSELDEITIKLRHLAGAMGSQEQWNDAVRSEWDRQVKGQFPDA